MYFLKERYSRNWPFTVARTVLARAAGGRNRSTGLCSDQEVQLLDCCANLCSVLLGRVVNKNVPMLWVVSTKTDNIPCGFDVLSFLLSLQTPPVTL